MKKIKPIFVHCAPDTGHDNRFDTVMMPNGSIAALCQIVKTLQQKYQHLIDPLAVDEQYLRDGKSDRDTLLTHLHTLLDDAIRQNVQPVVLCTLLSYNAEGSLALLKELKTMYGSSIRTGVGGQLIRTCPHAYLQNSYIDHVGIGDAEAVLEPLLMGNQHFAAGYLKINESHYSKLNYGTYLGLEDRLGEMSRYRLGPFTNIRQLLTESVRGCAWAHAFKICDMCSLEGVSTNPVFKPLVDHFQIERDLGARYDCNWVFDVSNQWLPVMGQANQLAWLQNYLQVRKQYGEYNVNRYVYLTANSITPETAPLIRKTGVRIAYVGLDGWDQSTRTALHKTQAGPEQMLDAARAAGIYIRTSMVIGSGLTVENLKLLPQFVQHIAGGYGDIILSWGNFLEIILPGSPVWYSFQKFAQDNAIAEAQNLYQFFYENGYLSWPQQEKLTELYIRHTQPVPYEAVVAARDQAQEIIKKSPIVGITITEGGTLSKP